MLAALTARSSKRTLLIFLVSLAIFTSVAAHAKNTYTPNSSHVYITGPKGGCYYINKHGNKTYVARALCHPTRKRNK